MSATAVFETSLLIHIEQILDGDEKCHCGAEAVLVVLTEPDQEPGATCAVHAFQWIDANMALTRKLFAPKES